LLCACDWFQIKKASLDSCHHMVGGVTMAGIIGNEKDDWRIGSQAVNNSVIYQTGVVCGGGGFSKTAFVKSMQQQLGGSCLGQ
jgi:hypothetical protein